MEQSPWETTSAKERKQSSAFKRLHCLTTLRMTLSLSKMNAPRRPQNFNSLKRLEHDLLRFFVQHACSYNVTLTLPSHGVWIATVEFGGIRRPYKLISKIAGHDEAEQVSNCPACANDTLESPEGGLRTEEQDGATSASSASTPTPWLNTCEALNPTLTEYDLHGSPMKAALPDGTTSTSVRTVFECLLKTVQTGGNSHRAETYEGRQRPGHQDRQPFQRAGDGYWVHLQAARP